DFPGRSNEGSPRDVFIVPRLFANQHHRCAFRTFTKNRLRCALVKVTRLAIFRRIAHGRPARCVGRLYRTGELLLLIRSHVPVKNRKSATLQLPRFWPEKRWNSKQNDSFCALSAKKMSIS